jgi:hypothetical protein
VKAGVCEVYVTPAAEPALEKLKKRDPKRAVRIFNAFERVENYGWANSTKLKLIKELDGPKQVGEIRDLGKGGFRILFYWCDTHITRELHVTHVEPKANLTPSRLRTLIDAAYQRSKEYGDC